MPEPLVIGNLQRLRAVVPPGRVGAPAARRLLTPPWRKYRQWLTHAARSHAKALRARWGEPGKNRAWCCGAAAEAVFVVPRLMLGKIAASCRESRHAASNGTTRKRRAYHSPSALPSHYYLAATCGRARAKSDAALGALYTHGSQEWLPGKDRPVGVRLRHADRGQRCRWPTRYIADNIGEAQQAKTPGLIRSSSATRRRCSKPVGLHARHFTRMHDLLHRLAGAGRGGPGKNQGRPAGRRAERAHRPRHGTGRPCAQRIPCLCGPAAQPHSARTGPKPPSRWACTPWAAPEEQHRLATVLLMLGRPFWEAAGTARRSTGCRCGRGPNWRLQPPGADGAHQLLQRHVIEG